MYPGEFVRRDKEHDFRILPTERFELVVVLIGAMKYGTTKEIMMGWLGLLSGAGYSKWSIPSVSFIVRLEYYIDDWIKVEKGQRSE